MGKVIAKYTEKVYVKDKVLFIYTTNSAMKNELLYMKADIIKKINEAIEVNFVIDVLIK
jgi:predicted nucleic acid-binding Zn ribbon protein